MSNTAAVCLSILISLCISSCLGKSETKTAVQQKTFGQDSLSSQIKKKEEVVTNSHISDTILQIPNDSLSLHLKKVQRIEILSAVKHNDSLASTGEDFYTACQKWSLSSKQIEQIFWASEPISGEEWHYLYDVFPCYYKGVAKLNDIRLSFSINSGSYFIFSNKDTTFFYGYTGKKYRKFFMSEPWDGKE